MSQTSPSQPLIRLGMMPTAEAERLRTMLKRHEIEIATAFNHATCTTGCSPSLEVWVREEDAPEVMELMQDARRRAILAEGGDPELVDRVFDVDAESATCPACATEFSTKLSECPDCGLAFALPDGAR